MKEKSKENLDIIKSFLNKPLKIEGLKLLNKIPDNTISAVFFDPQYKGILDKMPKKTIVLFIEEINRVLKPSGYLFMWLDKFNLWEGIKTWFKGTKLNSIDLMVWGKNRIGKEWDIEHKCEFLRVLQKQPIKIKSSWTVHNIPNVIKEDVDTKKYPHSKPIELQRELIEAVTQIGDIILDPCCGSGSVFESCKQLINRNFLGGDINAVM